MKLWSFGSRLSASCQFCIIESDHHNGWAGLFHTRGGSHHCIGSAERAEGLAAALQLDHASDAENMAAGEAYRPVGDCEADGT